MEYQNRLVIAELLLTAIAGIADFFFTPSISLKQPYKVTVGFVADSILPFLFLARL